MTASPESVEECFRLPIPNRAAIRPANDSLGMATGDGSCAFSCGRDCTTEGACTEDGGRAVSFESRLEDERGRLTALSRVYIELNERVMPILVSRSPVCVDEASMDDLLLLDSLAVGAFSGKEPSSAIVIVRFNRCNTQNQ